MRPRFLPGDGERRARAGHLLGVRMGQQAHPEGKPLSSIELVRDRAACAHVLITARDGQLVQAGRGRAEPVDIQEQRRSGGPRRFS